MTTMMTTTTAAHDTNTTMINNDGNDDEQPRMTMTTAYDALEEDVQCVDPPITQQPTRNVGREEMVVIMTATTFSTNDNDKQHRNDK